MLAEKKPPAIFYGGKNIRLNLDYRSILSLFELQTETLLDDKDKVNVSLDILVKSKRHIWFMNISDRCRLLKEIYEKYITPKQRPGASGGKLVDFKQDARYIYPSFKQAYDVNLDIAKINWIEFLSLFQGLPEDTKIREIMSIRGRPVPEPTKYNQKEIAALIQAKAFYAIEYSEEEAETRFNEGINRLTDNLLRRAAHG